MGVDRGELIAEVEIRYGLEIPDVVRKNIRTVGDLYEHVLNGVNSIPAASRFLPHCFLRFRRALYKDFGFSKSELKTDTPLAEVFPPKNRREDWKKFSESLGLLLPALRNPRWLDTATALILGTGLLSVFLHLEDAHYIMATSLVLIAAIWKFGYPLMKQFPHGIETLNVLATYVLKMNERDIRLGPGGSTAVLKEIVEIIARQAGVKPEEVTPESRLVEDLGVKQEE